MAHFALIENDIVQQVIVIPDEEESNGEEFIHSIGLTGTWLQASITGRIRKVFAEPGFAYLPEIDAFKAPKPEGFDSYVFNEEAWCWTPPTQKPEDGKTYTWDEASASWVAVSAVPPSWIDGKPPVEAPKDGKGRVWNEETLSWELVALPEGWIYAEDGKPAPPKPMPENGNIWLWDVETMDWVDSGETMPPMPELLALKNAERQASGE